MLKSISRSTRRTIRARKAILAAAASVAIAYVVAPKPALAVIYTYTPSNPTGDTWSTGADWSATPVSATTAELTFVGSKTTVLANSLLNTNSDDISGLFQLNILDLQGTGPASGAGVITIATSGGSTGLDFTGANDTINLNALAGTAGLTYNVSAPITLGGNTTFTGNGTATFNFSGAISGLAFGITQSGTSTLTLSGANGYTGATTINAGTINLGGGTATGSISSSSALVLGGGTLSYTTTGTNTQTFHGTTVAAGQSYVNNTVSTDTIALGALAQTAGSGGAVNFTNTGPITTTTANNATGILGAWATFGNNGSSTATATWAANNGSGTIIPYAGYTNLSATVGTSYTNAQVTSTGNYLSGATSAAPNGTNFVTQFTTTGTTTINTLTMQGDVSIANGDLLVLAGGGLVMNGNARYLLNNNNGTTAGTGQLTTGLASGELFVDVADAQMGVGGNATNWRVWDNIVNNAIPTILVKTGPGELTLEYSSTYTGGTIVNSGVLGSFVATTGSPGSITAGPIGTGTLTVNTSGAYVMDLNGSTGTVNNTVLNLANNIVLNGGALWSIDDYSHVTGTITVNSAGGFLGSTYAGGSAAYSGTVAQGFSKGLFVDGVVSGSGNLVLEQAGIGGNGAIAEPAGENSNESGNNFNQSIVMFTNNSNTYSGTLTVTGSGGNNNTNYLGVNGNTALQFATINVVGSNGTGSANWGASPVLFETAGTANVVGDSFSFGALQGSGPIALTEINEGNLAAGNSVALTVGGNNASTTYSGIMSGGGSLTKTGSGTFTLAGANSYTGTTMVSNGTLAITTGGSISASSPINVSSGALLTTSVNNTFGGTPTGAWTIAGTITGTANAQTMPASITLNNGAMTGATFATFGTFLTPAGGTTITANGASNTLSSGNVGLAGGVTFTTPLATDVLTVSSVLGASSAQGGGVTKTGLGTVTLSAANIYSGPTLVNAGMLNISGTGSISNATNLTVGNAAGNPVLNYTSSGTSSVNTITLGATSGTAVGAIYQSAGTMTQTQGAGTPDFAIGNIAGAYGYYNVSGTASLTTNEIGVGGANGGAGTIGMLDVTGGTYTDTGWLTVARGGAGETGVLNVSGSAAVVLNTAATNNRFYLNQTAGSTSIVNLLGSGTITGPLTTSSYWLDLNGVGGNSTSIVNLDGSSKLQIYGVEKTVASTSPVLFNFNGGTLKATTANTGFFGNVATGNAASGAYVYGNGGTIDNNGVAITIAQVLMSPTLNGVTAMAAPSGSSGYVAPPLVTITGGGGTGATAIATISGGAVTGFTITNPGTGYTGTPTYTLSGGGGIAGTAGAITTAANTSGTLTFQGVGATTLTGLSTFNGNLTVAGGNVFADLNNNFSNPTSSALGNPSATRTITVNSGATLTLQTGNVLGTGSWAPPSTLAMNISGTLTNTSADTNTLGAVTLNGGTITASIGTGSTSYQSYVLNGTVTATGTAQSTISTLGTTNAGYHLGVGTNQTVTFNVDPNSTGASLLISAPLIGGSGTAGGAAGSAIVKSGVGTLTLAGVNTYSGATTISAGTLSLTGTIGSGAGTAVSSAATFNEASTGIIAAGSLTVTGGTTTLAGLNTYTGATTVNGGVLNVTGSINNGNSANAGQIIVANSTANAVMTINGGTVLATSNTAAPLEIGGAAGTGAGALIINSGTLTTSGEGEIYLGADGTTGQANFGAMTINGGTVTSGNYFALGRGLPNNNTAVSSTGELIMNAGTLTVGNNNLEIGSFQLNPAALNLVSMSGGAIAITAGNLTVAQAESGILDMSGGTITMSTAGDGVHFNNSTGQLAIVNLRGGTITAGYVNTGSASLTSIFNFNGGTLKASQSNGTFMTGLTAAYVYSGGGTIDNGGNVITIGQALQAASGSNGLNTITVSGGTGYIAPPIVNITGGGGSGATAAATINASGVITGITITNPGTGYTSTPSVTLVGGGGSGATISAVALNSGNAASGLLTFQGIGTTTLTANSTFNGNLTVASGTLIADYNNNVSNATSGALGNPSAARTITVNSGATLNLALGNVLGTGAWAPPSTLAMNISGTLTNTSGDTNTLGAVTLNGGTITASKGTGSNSYQSYVLNGTVTATGSTQSTISTLGTSNAGYHLGVGTNQTVTFNVDPNATGASLVISAPLIGGSGAAGGATGSAIIKSGVGTLTLSGVNTYSGATTISAGTLNLTGSLGASAVAVNGGATLNATGTIGGPVVIAAGATPATQGTFSVVNGLGTGTATLGGSLTLGDVAGSSSNLLLEAGAGVGAGNVITLGGALTVNAGGANISISNIGLAAGNTYNLINFGSASFNGSAFTNGSGATVDGLTLNNAASLTFGVSGTLNVTGNTVQLVTTGSTAPNTAYWTGNYGSLWTNTDGGSTMGNFSVDSGGVTAVRAYPASNTDVIFAATGAGNLTNTLGQDFAIHSLTFLAQDANGTIGSVTIGGSNTLTVGAGGITSNNASNFPSGEYLNMTTLTPGTSQTWTNNSGGPLSISAAVTGIATTGTTLLTVSNTSTGETDFLSPIGNGTHGGNLGLTINSTGSGQVLLAATNTYTGPTILTAGTLNLTGTLGSGGGSAITTGGTFIEAATGVIAGTSSFTMTGGSATLAGVNTYSGATTINGGTVNLTGSINAANTAGGAGQVTVGNTAAATALLNISGGTLNASTAANPSIQGGTVANAAGSIILNSGTLTTNNELWLSTVNGGYGSLTINGGAATIGSWLAIGRGGNEGVLNMNAGTLNITGANVTIASFGGNFGVATFAGGTTTATNAIYVGEGGGGVATISGNALVNAASVRVASNGGSTGVLNLLGGTLTTGSIGSSGTSNLIFNGGTIQASAASTTFLAGLTSAYVYSGNGTINNNAKAITIGQALLAPTGNGVSATGLSITGGSGYIDTPIVSISGGGGTGATAIANVSGGVVTGITITNPGIGYSGVPSFVLAGGGGSGASVATGTAAVVANASGGMTFQGAATTTLSGSNTYTGNTTITNTTLSVTGALGGGNYPGGILNNGSLSIAGAANQILSGPITGTGGLAKSNSGTLTLGGVDAYGGSTLLHAGTTIFDGTSAGSLSGAGFLSDGVANGEVATLTVQNGFTYGSAATTSDFNVADLAGSTGVLNVSGGTLNVGTLYVGKGSNSSTAAFGYVNQTGGAVQHGSAGGEWRIGGNSGAGDTVSVGVYNLSGGTLNTPNNLQIGAYANGEMNISGTGTVTIPVGWPVVGRFANSFGVLDVNGGSFTANNGGNAMIIGEQGVGILNLRGGAVTITATGGLRLGGGENTAGNVGIVNLLGGTLSTPVVGTFAGNGTDVSVFNFNGGTLKANTATTTFMSGLTNAYVYGGGGTVDNGSNNITIGQALLAPAGSGINTGAISVNSGSHYFAAPIVKFTGGMLSAGGAPATGVASIDGNGMVTSITITNPGNYTVAPTGITLAGSFAAGGSAATAPAVPALSTNVSGGLAFQGSAITTLTGSSTYSGPTAVNGGTLNLTGTLGSGGGTAINVANGATFTESSAGVIAGTSSLTVNGAATVSGANTYTGGTTVSGGIFGGGTLTVSGAGATLGSATSPLTVTNPNTGAGVDVVLNLNTAAGTTVGSLNGAVTGAFSGTNTATINTQTGQTFTVNQSAPREYDGVIAGPGNFALGSMGSSTLILGGANAYGGSTTIGAGATLQIDNGSATGSLPAASSIIDNGTLIFDRPDTIVQGTNFAAIAGTGGLTQSGSGTVVLTGSNSYSGGTNITAGTLQLGNGGVTGSIPNSTTLTVNGTLVFNRSNVVTQGTDFPGGIGGTGGITQAGTGTVVLNSVNSYFGTTNINAGVLSLAVGESGGFGGPLGTGVISFGGGTLQFTGSNSNDYSSRFSTANNQPIRIDTNGQIVKFANPLTSIGGTLNVQDTNAMHGALILTVANTYTGGTTVASGTLLVNNTTGSGTGAGSVTVTGGRLGGTGTIGNGTGTGAVVSINGGTLSPGPDAANTTVGTLYTGDQTWFSSLGGASTYNFKVDGENTGSSLTAAGVETAATPNQDFVDANGVLNIDTNTNGGTFVLAITGNTSPLGINSQFIVARAQTIEVNGAVMPAGTFISNDFTVTEPPQGSPTIDTVSIQTDTGAGGGFDVVVTPEPGSLGLLAVATLGLLRRRRANRKSSAKNQYAMN